MEKGIVSIKIEPGCIEHAIDTLEVWPAKITIGTMVKSLEGN